MESESELCPMSYPDRVLLPAVPAGGVSRFLHQYRTLSLSVLFFSAVFLDSDFARRGLFGEVLKSWL